MPYLIDGHNLIPKVPGLSLKAIDDEMQLVEKLQEFCRRRGKQVEVFFDKAPPGGRRVRVFGPVTARFPTTVSILVGGESPLQSGGPANGPAVSRDDTTECMFGPARRKQT